MGDGLGQDRLLELSVPPKGLWPRHGGLPGGGTCLLYGISPRVAPSAVYSEPTFPGLPSPILATHGCASRRRRVVLGISHHAGRPGSLSSWPIDPSVRDSPSSFCGNAGYQVSRIYHCGRGMSLRTGLHPSDISFLTGDVIMPPTARQEPHDQIKWINSPQTSRCCSCRAIRVMHGAHGVLVKDSPSLKNRSPAA